MKDFRRGLLATLPLASGVVAFGLLYGVVESFRERGCLCMENGEASTLFAVTQALGGLGGVLFQPYIELAQGWDPARLDEVYRATCRHQAEAMLEASIRLGRQGLPKSEKSIGHSPP